MCKHTSCSEVATPEGQEEREKEFSLLPREEMVAKATASSTNGEKAIDIAKHCTLYFTRASALSSPGN